MQYKVGKAARKLSTSLLSGEGFMTVFTGPGTVYVQTRSLSVRSTLPLPLLAGMRRVLLVGAACQDPRNLLRPVPQPLRALLLHLLGGGMGRERGWVGGSEGESLPSRAGIVPLQPGWKVNAGNEDFGLVQDGVEKWLVEMRSNEEWLVEMESNEKWLVEMEGKDRER